MRVQARFFAIHRERTGVDRLALEVSDGTTVEDLVGLVAERFPDLRMVLAAARFAVNREYAAPTVRLQNGDEVAFIPPVAGGGQ